MKMVNKRNTIFDRRTIAIILALANLSFAGCALNKTNNDTAPITTPDLTPEITPDLMPEETPFNVENGYSSVYNVEEVEKVANSIHTAINQDILISENEIKDTINVLEIGETSYIEELKQQITNGSISVEEIPVKVYEGIVFNLKNLDELMNFENQHNISIGLPRMLDNDNRGYQLAQEISDLRSNMYKAINSGDKESFTNYAQQFTNMYGKILAEGGPLVLNTSGEKAFILKYFDNTATYIFTYGDKNMKYVCANGGETTLISMVAELSEAICETENGRFPNQLSEAMNGMAIMYIRGLYVALGYDNVPVRIK